MYQTSESLCGLHHLQHLFIGDAAHQPGAAKHPAVVHIQKLYPRSVRLGKTCHALSPHYVKTLPLFCGIFWCFRSFHLLVHSIGVTMEAQDRELTADFCLQMYGHRDVYGSGTTLRMPVRANGMEHILELDGCRWSDDDNMPGQIM